MSIMIITNEMRETYFFKQVINAIKEGYFIEKSVNVQSCRKEEVVLYSFKKVNEDNTVSKICYFAKDVAEAISKEFNTVINIQEKISVWLNENPKKYKPEPGCKITFQY